MVRATAAVLVLLVPALVRSVPNALGSLSLGPDFRDTREIRAYDTLRFEGLRPLLKPFERVGFVEDAAPPDERMRPKVYVVRFALVPTVVVDDPRLPFVVANFRDPRYEPTPPPGLQYRLIADGSNGARLYAVGPHR